MARGGGRVATGDAQASQHRLRDDRHACAAGRQRHELPGLDLTGRDVAAEQARAEQLARAMLAPLEVLLGRMAGAHLRVGR